MKLNVFSLLIAILISVLAGWLINLIPTLEETKMCVGLGSGFMFLCMLVPALAIKMPESPRIKANITALSMAFLLLSLLSNLIFSFAFNYVAYLCVSGIVILIYAGVIQNLIGHRNDL